MYLLSCKSVRLECKAETAETSTLAAEQQATNATSEVQYAEAGNAPPVVSPEHEKEEPISMFQCVIWYLACDTDTEHFILHNQS